MSASAKYRSSVAATRGAVRCPITVRPSRTAPAPRASTRLTATATRTATAANTRIQTAVTCRRPGTGGTPGGVATPVDATRVIVDQLLDPGGRPHRVGVFHEQEAVLLAALDPAPAGVGDHARLLQVALAA